MLKRLELQGFKSFAKKSVLEFGSPITSIVGPNGSGKSNVAEAFRFALGEQSIKSMRGRKGEDLIWNGTTEMPKSSRASVKITFDNRKKFLNLDFEEVTVERAVYRDGVNEYFLNGTQVRLRDIVEMLAPTHIGPSGHHIISQGEADKILNAKMPERKAMIEDALGLRIYHYKKQESEKKLLKTEENIKQVGSLRRELSPHIKFLKRQFEKLQKNKELRLELRKIFGGYLTLERAYLDREKERLVGEKNVPQASLVRLEKELQVKTKMLKTGAPDEKKTRLFDLEKSLGELRVEKDSLTRNLGRFEGQIASLKRVIELNKNTSIEKLNISREEVEKLEKELKDFSAKIENSTDISFLKSIFKKFLQGISSLLRSEKVVEKDNNYEVELARLEGEKSTLELKIVGTRKREEDIQNSFKILQDEIEKEKDVSRDLERSVFRMKAEESSLRAAIYHLEESEKRLSFEEQNFQNDLKEAKVVSGEAVLDFLKKEAKVAPNADRIALKREIEKIKIRLEEAGGIGPDVEKEFNDITARDIFLEKELADLQTSSDSLKKLIKDLEVELNESFKSGVLKINDRFNTLFALMFDGGSASLTVVKERMRKKKNDEDEAGEILDENNPDFIGDEEEREGLDIKVSMPRKKVRGLEMLSGGERSLISIALIFAVSQVNPPPFLILDETDAALDEANSKRYGDMLESLAKSSQLILITHNRETMSRAGVLYGVTMGKDGYSKILSVAFEEALAVAK
ncbi:MAG: AAA family ATPase [Patescibacteria group bacterium]